MSNNAKEYEEKNAALKEEKDAIQTQFQALKKRMNTFRDQERKRLTELTILSNKVVKQLRSKVQHAEMIIKLAEMNRKLETEEEKIFPFYEEKESGTVDAGDHPELALEISLPEEFEGMQQFSKRYNKVLLDKVALDKKYDQLHAENQRLRDILKQYLDGITLSETVLSQMNPLLVVNGKTNAPLKNRGPTHVTYVEANHIVANVAAL
jgi:chromosome segregation ATPase